MIQDEKAVGDAFEDLLGALVRRLQVRVRAGELLVGLAYGFSGFVLHTETIRVSKGAGTSEATDEVKQGEIQRGSILHNNYKEPVLQVKPLSAGMKNSQ